MSCTHFTDFICPFWFLMAWIDSARGKKGGLPAAVPPDPGKGAMARGCCRRSGCSASGSSIVPVALNKVRVLLSPSWFQMLHIWALSIFSWCLFVLPYSFPSNENFPYPCLSSKARSFFCYGYLGNLTPLRSCVLVHPRIRPQKTASMKIDGTDLSLEGLNAIQRSMF